MKKLLFLFFLSILLFPPALHAQSYNLMAEREALAQVKKVTDNIYNSQHDKALLEINRLKQQVSANHPVFPMLSALNLYWQDAPMHTGSPYFEEFKGYLQETVRFSEAYLDKEQDETLVTFLALSAHSLLTRFHADKGDYMATIGAAKNAYAYMKEGFELTEEYSEFLFPVGLYNYYREKYPELHPVYRPFMFFFRSGDKEKGLEQLKYAARKNVFTKPESAVFLVHIYLYYENKPAAALQNITLLHQEYPQNHFLRIQLTEVLLANGLYSDAKPHIDYLLQQSAPYYKMSGELFQAIYLEKKERNYPAAANMYRQALRTAEPLSYMANVYRAMAYAGTARIHHQRQETEKARAAYKKAMELTSYEYPVKQEARNYLN
jgi:hypothetical protein